MTATATDTPTCPKCEGPMWDQKNGKFAWKQGTPIFKCRDKDCSSAGGVIWEPKGTVAKPAPKPPPSFANKPEAEIPPLLRNAEAEDAAELASKVGVDLTGLQKNLALYKALTEWSLREIAPLYVKSDIGWSPESATAAVATIFIQATKK